MLDDDLIVDLEGFPVDDAITNVSPLVPRANGFLNSLMLAYSQPQLGGGVDVCINTDVTDFQDWTNVATLFDSYKICALKIKFNPAFPNNLTATTAYAPVYLAGDPDVTNATGLGSVNTIIQYENCKVHNLYRPWSYYYKLPKVMSTGTSSVMLQGGYFPSANPAIVGGIYIYTEGLSISSTYGSIMVTAYMVCRNRK